MTQVLAVVKMVGGLAAICLILDWVWGLTPWAVEWDALDGRKPVHPLRRFEQRGG